MKKQQLRFWLGLCAAVTIFEIMPLATPVKAQNCQAYNSSVVTSVRGRNIPTGNILIKNNFGPTPQSGAVSIKLYHSDAPDRVFSRWDLVGGEQARLSYNDKSLVIGGDWGVQVVFGNGVTSCISPIADVGRFENGRYVVLATDINNRGNPQPQLPAVSFPITGEKDDAISNGRMRTSFTLSSNGQLSAVTNTRTKVKLAGFTGGASIILVNENRQPIWASSAHAYGVDGCFIGRCDRNDNWTDSVPPDILRQVRGYAILQQHDPKWLSLVGQRGDQFLRWLNSDDGKATITTIGTIAAML
jgi:hypothetical protein